MQKFDNQGIMGLAISMITPVQMQSLFRPGLTFKRAFANFAPSRLCEKLASLYLVSRKGAKAQSSQRFLPGLSRYKMRLPYIGARLSPLFLLFCFHCLPN